MSKTSSTSSGETKQDDTQLHLLGAKLIPSATTKEELISTDLVRWTSIFSYLHFNEHERLSVRNLCCLFHTVLPGPTCTGVYTIFPHPKHPSLNSLMNRLNAMARVEGSNLPENLFLANGVHVIEIYQRYGRDCNIVEIHFPISIIGESREHCIVRGGLLMKGKKEDDVNVSNLTLRDSKDCGVRGNCAPFHLDNVSVENSGDCGVVVSGAKILWTRSNHTGKNNGVYKRSTMKNCNVSHSARSGLFVMEGGLMTIDGNGTTIHHNCTNGNSGEYGLHAGGPAYADPQRIPSSIHLASSSTIETISKNNGGGGNYGGDGAIAIVQKKTIIIETVIETIQEATPEDDSEEDY
jgi:uncharacterized protein YkuJ